jgi:hypothetical protein
MKVSRSPPSDLTEQLRAAVKAQMEEAGLLQWW